MNLLQELEAEQVTKLAGERPVPPFQPGDTVRVSVREGARLPDQDLEVDLGPGDWVWIPAGVTYTLKIVANPVRFRYRH